MLLLEISSQMKTESFFHIASCEMFEFHRKQLSIAFRLGKQNFWWILERCDELYITAE